jgi:hypothetical protein
MRNITTPIDMIGALITDRRPGEPLWSYRRRVLKVAGVLTKRDPSSSNWRQHREEELSGRTGYPVRLYEGQYDDELLETAQEQLLTYDRLDSWTDGPIRWPEYGASGNSTLYNRAAPIGNGVGSESDLVPALDRETGRYFCGSGFVVIDGQIWYIPAEISRLQMRLPEGTKKTVLLPYQIDSNHAHSIEIVSTTRVRMVGSDGHTHLLEERGGIIRQIRFRQGARYGRHDHALFPIETEGPAFISIGPHRPTINDTARIDSNDFQTIPDLTRTDTTDGFLGIPVLNLRGVEVQTQDDAHKGWVSPYDYYQGVFSIGDYTHRHDVEWAEDGSELVCRPAGIDSHSHRIDAPAVPESRIVVPVQEARPNEMHPFMVNVKEEKGWTVVESEYGLGPVLTLAFDVGEVREIPVSQPRPDYVVGIGSRKPASHVHVLETRPEAARPDQVLEVLVRTEDEHTGGVPHQALFADVTYVSENGSKTTQTAYAVAAAVSDFRAEAVVRIKPTLVATDITTLQIDFFLGDPDDRQSAVQVNRHVVPMRFDDVPIIKEEDKSNSGQVDRPILTDPGFGLTTGNSETRNAA